MDVELGTGIRAHESRLAEFAQVSHLLMRQPDPDQTIQAVLDEALRVTTAESADILLVEGRRIITPSASEPEVDRATAMQLQLGEGPGLDSILRRRDLISGDLATDTRWSLWAPQAVRLGWRSVLSVGLANGETIGSLNLYASRTDAFDAQSLAVAEVFAIHAASALTMSRERATLTQAVDARHLIGQAQGILMERFKLDAEEAFNVLRRYSSHGNRKLRLVAADLVEQRRLPGELEEAAG